MHDMWGRDIRVGQIVQSLNTWAIDEPGSYLIELAEVLEFTKNGELRYRRLNKSNGLGLDSGCNLCGCPEKFISTLDLRQTRPDMYKGKKFFY